MKRRILGFQRRVWWPKWTPASSSSRIPTSGTVRLLGWYDVGSVDVRRGPGTPRDRGDRAGPAGSGDRFEGTFRAEVYARIAAVPRSRGRARLPSQPPVDGLDVADRRGGRGAAPPAGPRAAAPRGAGAP